MRCDGPCRCIETLLVQHTVAPSQTEIEVTQSIDNKTILENNATCQSTFIWFVYQNQWSFFSKLNKLIFGCFDPINIFCAAPAFFQAPLHEVRRTMPVLRCGMTVMQMIFTIWIGRGYLSYVMSHRELSSQSSLDLRIAQYSHAPMCEVRRGLYQFSGVGVLDC